MKWAKGTSPGDGYETYLSRKRAEDDLIPQPVYRSNVAPDVKRRRNRIFLALLLIAAFGVLFFAMLIRSIQENQAYDRYIQEAQLSTLEGDYDSALASLRKAIAIDVSDECLLMMAQCYEAQGNYDKAIEALRTMKSTDAAITSKIASIEAKKKIKANAGLVSINGKSHSITETSLVLDNQNLGDGVLPEVSKMYALSNLSLAGNGITEISELSSLGGLTVLNLSNNSVQDLSPLSALPGLRTLYLDNNPVRDLSPLYSLQSLTMLSIKGVSLTDDALKALSNALPNCAINGASVGEEDQLIALGGETFQADVTTLDLSGRGLTDITALSACRNLTALNLSGNSISDIMPLMDIPSLQTLTISYNNISDLRPLMGLLSIRTLDVSYNMVSLQELNLAGNSLSNFTGLDRLRALTSLNLSATGLTDEVLDSLFSLSQLRYLNVENNNGFSGNGYDRLRQALPGCNIVHSELVYSIPAETFTVMTDSTELNLSNSGVTDLSFLLRLNNLVTLRLSGNGITSISAFQYTESYRTLLTLDLSRNNIVDLTAITGLQNLTSLDLSYNQISNVMPLYTLRNLRELNLMGNPVSEEQIRDLNTLLPYCFILH